MKPKGAKPPLTLIIHHIIIHRSSLIIHPLIPSSFIISSIIPHHSSPNPLIIHRSSLIIHRSSSIIHHIIIHPSPMPLTPEQIAKMRQKQADTPDALKRNPLYAYTEGWFHVTLNVRDEAPMLGYIIGNAEAEDGSANAPKCVLTELGRKVEEIWNTVDSFHPMCICEEMQVMPEHIHALLHLLPGNNEHLGRIINGLMIGCTHAYWDTLGIPWQKMRKEKDAAASTKADDKALRAQWQDRDHTRSFRGPSLFVHGYNDVEALNDEEISIKRQYIRNNPRKHLIQRDKPDLFRVRRNMKSANWTPERITQGLCADRFIATNHSRQTEALHHLAIKGTINSPLLDLVGNMQLLHRPLFPLICHRADAHLFEQQKAAVLKVAREQGGVIVTACVSPKEREIVKQLQQELLPVIEVMDNGFNDRYKPSGKAFYAVAEQRRLEISPWEYIYRRREDAPDISREMCMVMNELVRMIAKKEDGWWKNIFKWGDYM